MIYDREYILRYLDGTLSPEASRALEEALPDDLVLRGRIIRMREMRSAMMAGRADSFALGFGDRVLARMRGGENGDDALYRALSRVFRRAAIASLIAAVAFGALNLASYQNEDVSTTVFESIFGLPAASLGDALAVEPV